MCQVLRRGVCQRSLAKPKGGEAFLCSRFQQGSHEASPLARTAKEWGGKLFRHHLNQRESFHDGHFLVCVLFLCQLKRQTSPVRGRPFQPNIFLFIFFQAFAPLWLIMHHSDSFVAVPFNPSLLSFHGCSVGFFLLFFFSFISQQQKIRLPSSEQNYFFSPSWSIKSL